MKKFTIIMTVMLVSIGIYCGRNTKSSKTKMLNVRIKAGVILKSGDVKNVARQDFIVSKGDLLKSWESSKKNNKWNHNVIEEETKADLGYGAKLNTFEESIKQKELTLNQLQANSQSKVRIVVRQFSKHIEQTCQEGQNHGVGYYFDLFRTPSEPYEVMFRDVDKRYSDVMTYPIDQGAKQFIASRYAEFKRINDSFKIAISEVSAQQNELERVRNESELFLENYAKEVANREKTYFEKAKADFFSNFQNEYIAMIKTDLSGEAKTTLPKGGCFFFGFAEIGLNFISWNYKADITEDGQYIELSNDNAYSFKREDISQFLSVLGDIGKR